MLTGGVNAHRPVLTKFALVSVAMVTLPIGAYFGSLNFVWARASFASSQPLLYSLAERLSLPRTAGNTTAAGITAAVVANVVLIAYVILALLEDDGSASKGPAAQLADQAKKDK